MAKILIMNLKYSTIIILQVIYCFKCSYILLESWRIG